MKHLPKSLIISNCILALIVFTIFLFGITQLIKGGFYHLFGEEITATVIADVDTGEEKYVTIEYEISGETYTDRIHNFNDKLHIGESVTVHVSNTNHSSYVIFPRYLYVSLLGILCGTHASVFYIIKLIKFIKKRKIINKLIKKDLKVQARIIDSYYEEKKRTFGLVPFYIICEKETSQEELTKYKSDLIYKPWDNITGIIGNTVYIYIDDSSDNYFVDIDSIKSRF